MTEGFGEWTVLKPGEHAYYAPDRIAKIRQRDAYLHRVDEGQYPEGIYHCKCGQNHVIGEKCPSGK